MDFDLQGILEDIISKVPEQFLVNLTLSYLFHLVTKANLFHQIFDAVRWEPDSFLSLVLILFFLVFDLKENDFLNLVESCCIWIVVLVGLSDGDGNSALELVEAIVVSADIFELEA